MRIPDSMVSVGCQKLSHSVPSSLLTSRLPESWMTAK
uniref:Kik1 n=1 Tax=Arundo donax TaxID=35708 RepID=A0A0A9GGR2_ARUDO